MRFGRNSEAKDLINDLLTIHEGERAASFTMLKGSPADEMGIASGVLLLTVALGVIAQAAQAARGRGFISDQEYDEFRQRILEQGEADRQLFPAFANLPPLVDQLVGLREILNASSPFASSLT